MSEEEPKIFIDEGWKAQVQREKEMAARKAEAERQAAAPKIAQEAPATAPAAAPEAPAPPDAMEDEDPASFNALVGTLATQAMFALGLIADPESGQVMVNLDAARYTLDMMLMLREKTRGNLTQEEADSLAQASGELEQAFAVRVQQFQEQAMRQAGIGPGVNPKS